MNKETKALIHTAVEAFAGATGLKAGHRYNARDKNRFPDGRLCIDQKKLRQDLAIQVKKAVTRTTVGLRHAELADDRDGCILLTTYIAPPIADLMRKNDLFFMDTAGNAYINKFPLYVFIKGNKPAEKTKAATMRRIWKPAGLKVIFAMLNNPDRADRTYRQIAAATGTALGTVEWTIRDLKATGFLLDMGRRKRRLTNKATLLKRWVEAYPEQLRPKIVIDTFTADDPGWWKAVKIGKYGGCWGGEVAAAKLTRRLKPQMVTIYADQLPGRLIIDNKLRRATDGEIEILKPFWNFEHDLTKRDIAPPLLVYADLMATGDQRNVETAGIIHDKYLARLDRKD